MKRMIGIIIVSACCCAGVNTAFAEADGGKLFKKKCGMCHKVDKKGMGPSVLTMNTDPAVLKSTILDGRKAMPSFDEKLDTEQIDALLAFIQSQQAVVNPCEKNMGGQ